MSRQCIITCNDVKEEVHRRSQLSGRLPLPPAGEERESLGRDVDADGRELDEVAIDLQPPRTLITYIKTLSKDLFVVKGEIKRKETM